MDVATAYTQAYSEYKAKNYERAIEIVTQIEKVAPTLVNPKTLKACILRAQKLFVSEIAVLETIETNPSDKKFMRDLFSELWNAYNICGLSKNMIKCGLIQIEFEDDLDNILKKLTAVIFYANYLEDFTATKFRKLYDMYQQKLYQMVTAQPKQPKYYNHDKIRVGYLSADFREHVLMYFSWSLLTGLDERVFTVYCYYSNAHSDGVTGIIKNIVANWRDISKMSYKEAADLISNDEIDILFDLSGHTGGTRLPVMAFRPARIQISGIGYMNSTGLNCVDYFLSDKFCAEDDVAMKKYFTEKIIKLPHSHLCYTPFRHPIPDPADAPCIKNGYVTFGCFNTFKKVTNTMLSAWLKILNAVPNSRLIIKSSNFLFDEPKNFVIENLKRFGFDISRIDLHGYSYSYSYLNEYNDIDIALDTFPYCGGTTTCDTLYMGVPVISLYGDRHGTRFGYSILNNIGIGELAVKTIDEYIQLAVGLANDYELLSYLHKNLRGMMERSPIMNQDLYIRDIENVFKQLLNACTNNFSQALAEYNSKNYDRALEILAAIDETSSDWEKSKLLTAYIYRDQGKIVSQISVLEQIDIAAIERGYADNVFLALADAYRKIGLSEKSVTACLASNEFSPKLYKIGAALFVANYLSNFSAKDFQKLYELYRKQLSETVKTPLPPKIYNHDKIRVGYLSGDFCDHVVMNFAWVLLIGLDKSKFHVYCYSNNIREDAVSENIKTTVENWRDITNLSDADAAKLIRNDEIDILFDLSGYTVGYRLPIMAYRPARVQISGIGYMNSTGLECVDYFISDVFCAEDDIAMKKYFTEKIIKLPNTHLCYAPFKIIPKPAGDAPCIKNGYVTFGCFNNFSKMTDSMLRAWQKILNAVPKSKLILKSGIFKIDECKSFITERLKNLGFDVAQVELRGLSLDYLNEYKEIDIALDTYPYCGGGTTCEALYMGVPVISLYGDRHGTRFGYSLLNNIGAGELAASNIDGYIKRAVELANNFELISYLHKNLRGWMERSPIMNQGEYVHDVENAFIQIYKQG